MRLLAIESSCDETSASVVEDGVIRSTVVASQTRLHSEYGGVVPELATREHLRNLIPVTRAALDQAGVSVLEMDRVVATRGPGLPAALMAGYRAAQALAWSLGRPFEGLHHHEAHLYSPWIAGDPPAFDSAGFQPHLSLIVSGGHTLLVRVQAPLRHRVLGGTLDDAAGECFDKSAKLIGLGYPGGPLIDRLAAHGNGRAVRLPRPMMDDPGDDFSFSGLKTAVRYHLRDHPGAVDTDQGLADVCASVQEAILDVLAGKLFRAARREGVKCVTVSGGVACNTGLRRRLAAEGARLRIQVRIASPSYCTDNAGMVGVLGWLRTRHAEPTMDAGPTLIPPVEGDVLPGWELDPVPASGS